jgi:hypothetical protein
MKPLRIAPLALLAAGAVAGGVLASSLSASADTPTPAPSDRQAAAEAPLTGDVKSKVEAAVKAKYPGATVSGLETSRRGDYEATVTKSDGTSLEVHVAKDYTIREGRPGRGGGAPEVALTGDAASKVEAAVKGTYPGATVSKVETSRDGEYEATVKKADGTTIEVHVSKDYATVTEGHGGGRPDGGGPDPQQG